jgi:hypothetical protein
MYRIFTTMAATPAHTADSLPDSSLPVDGDNEEIKISHLNACASSTVDQSGSVETMAAIKPAAESMATEAVLTNSNATHQKPSQLSQSASDTSTLSDRSGSAEATTLSASLVGLISGSLSGSPASPQQLSQSSSDTSTLSDRAKSSNLAPISESPPETAASSLSNVSVSLSIASTLHDQTESTNEAMPEATAESAISISIDTTSVALTHSGLPHSPSTASTLADQAAANDEIQPIPAAASNLIDALPTNERPIKIHHVGPSLKSILSKRSRFSIGSDAASVDSNATLTGSAFFHSTVSEPDATITVYAAQTYVASLEGQVCILKGDMLTLLDDSNSFWWLVRCAKTQEVGYVPAETIEVREFQEFFYLI